MPTFNGTYILKASGSPIDVDNGKVCAVIAGDFNPQKWVITPVSESGEEVVIQTLDRSKAWTVPSSNSDEDVVQITVESFNSNSPAPNQIFRFVQVESDWEDEEELIHLQTKTSGIGVGRLFAEDRSLLPKGIFKIPDQNNIQTEGWKVEPA